MELNKQIYKTPFEKPIQKEESQNSFISTGEKSRVLSDKYNNSKNKNEIASTMPSINDKHYYNNIEHMYELIDIINPRFRETFELTNFISFGGTGIVYEGNLLKSKNHQKLAFKFKLNQKKKNDESQEISILKKLHHKNTTQIYAFIRMNENCHFSVLELGKHGDIEHFQKVLLKRKVLSETIICYFAKQILEALDYIHKCKIIHMDIKQGNIIVDSDLNLKLTDFSVSCSYAAFHPEDLVKYPYVGTSKYMSPEILNKTHMKIKDSCKIDMYSLGVTLYNMAFDIYPFKLDEVGNKDYSNILKNIINEKLEFPKDRKVSESFKDFLKRLLEKDYSKRLSIKQALIHPWIQGAQIIFDEKEQAFCHENFLINLITDDIPKFNEYLKRIDINLNNIY